MTTAANSSESLLARSQDEVADIFGTIAEFWGFPRTQGRIYGLLMCSPEPLDQSAIKDRLQISAGSASMTLAALLEWGAIERRGRLYRAQTDLWLVITTVFRRRERAEVESAIQRLGKTLELLRQASPTDPRVRFCIGRIETLQEFFLLGRNFLDAFVSRGRISSLLHSIAQTARKSLRAGDPDVRFGA